MRVCVIFGTRPEAIKLAPLVHQLRRRSVETTVISTGQHKELIAPVLDLFDIRPDVELDVMRSGQELDALTARLIEGLGEALRRSKCTHLFVQGDTTTAFAAALVGFYQGLWVGHVEAGLRTGNVKSPFPEEANRRFVSVVADRHYAPTMQAAQNLLDEGTDARSLLVTGNTVVDALRWVQENKTEDLDQHVRLNGLEGKKFILATLHRRENIGAPLDATLVALKSFLSQRPDWSLVLPMHRNPLVRAQITSVLEAGPQILLLEAQGYKEFCGMMKNCGFILTDSGGIQEEAPYLNKRTIVVRDTTERPEAIDAGTSWLAGIDAERIGAALVNAAREVDEGQGLKLRHINPFGDGTATLKIVDDLQALHD